MAISIKLGQKQSQKLILTQSLRQSIEMLQLSTVELSELIAEEMVENPMLEEAESTPISGTDTRNEELISRLNQRLSGDDTLYQRKEEQRLNNLDASDRGYSSVIDDDDRKRKFIENAVLYEESLEDHLLWQARLLAENARELTLYENIITSINDNGYITTSAEDFAHDSDYTLDEVMKAIATISLLDPIGCGLSSVRESLVIQAEHFFKDDPLLKTILTDYFDELKKLNYDTIVRALSVSLDEVIKKSKLIQGLNPYPGRQYSNKKIRYIIPDVEVRYIDNAIIVDLNDDWVPRVGVSNFYLNLLKKKDVENKIKDYIQDKMQAARYLIKNISNRRDTIMRVVTTIMQYQVDFLKKGPGHLKPLTHVVVARELDLHESTISRVTSNKFVQTHWGVFELKYFFVSRLKSEDNNNCSSDEVINLIKDILAHEDPVHPFTDDEILKRLIKSGVTLARRTVAKYRGQLNIPSSNKRKKLNMIKKRGADEH